MSSSASCEWQCSMKGNHCPGCQLLKPTLVSCQASLFQVASHMTSGKMTCTQKNNALPHALASTLTSEVPPYGNNKLINGNNKLINDNTRSTLPSIDFRKKLCFSPATSPLSEKLPQKIIQRELETKDWRTGQKDCSTYFDWGIIVGDAGQHQPSDSQPVHNQKCI